MHKAYTSEKRDYRRIAAMQIVQSTIKNARGLAMCPSKSALCEASAG